MENFDLKKFLVENKLTTNSRILRENEEVDRELIEKWFFETNPQADELTPEQEEEGIQAHFDEWMAVKDQYTGINDYFADIERQGDWYPVNEATTASKDINENAFINGKKVDLDSLEVEGIHRDDFPDFVDAYIVSAEFEDGTPLTYEQVDEFNTEYPEYIQEFIHDRQLYLENKKEIRENVEIVNSKRTYLEFMYQGKLHKVDFDNYEPTEGHDSGFSTGYIWGKDQFGNVWSIDAEFDMGELSDWDPDTIEMI